MTHSLTELEMSSVMGGLDRTQLLSAALDKRFEPNGVSFQDKPTFRSSGAPGRWHASGHVELEAAWGIPPAFRYSATVDTRHQSVRSLATRRVPL